MTLGGPGGPGAVQRVGGHGCRSASCRPTGCAAGSARAGSTCCTCTSRPCRRSGLLACWVARGPDRGHLPRLLRALPRARRWPRRSCRARWRRSPAGSPCPTRPARRWSSTSGGDAVLIPNGVTVEPLRRGRAAARLGPGRRRDRLPRPDGRAAQGPARAAGGVRRCSAAERPGLRLLHRRARRRRATCCDRVPSRPARQGRPARPGQRGRQGPRLPLGGRLLRAQPGRRELRHRARPRRCRPARRSWPATSPRSAGCSARARRARCSPTGDAAVARREAAALLDDPARRGQAVGRGRTAVRKYDWSTVARDVLRVYETVAASTAGVVEDDTA